MDNPHGIKTDHENGDMFAKHIRLVDLHVAAAPVILDLSPQKQPCCDIPNATADKDIDIKAGDVADYLASMLRTLEVLAQRRGLDVLSLMIAMACEQAHDDALARKMK
ncbi:MAG: hypothetical protein AB8B88_05725 [Devosiaceae bacterium]